MAVNHKGFGRDIVMETFITFNPTPANAIA